MSNMKQLTGLMKQLEDQLAVCMRCGMCQAVCPLFAQTGRESDVARGKLALLDGLLKEMFEDPDGVYERLNKCLLCGSCAANCPSGVEVLEIFMKARAIITEFMGLSPAKKLVLRGMLSRPELFDRVMEWGGRLQKLFTRPVNETVGTSCARFTTPLLEGRHFKPLAPKPFHRMMPSLNTQPGKSGIKIGFFVGCLIDKLFPDIAVAAMKVMAHHEVGVFMPQSQGCCAIPAVSSGDMRTFRQLVKYNVAKFQEESFDYLITACATCTSTIKKVWPILIYEMDKAENRKDGLLAEVEKIAAKTLDINQFLVSQVGIESGPVDTGEKPEKITEITYHDPCHLKKSLGVFEQPRRLIRANPAYRLEEMLESDWCCGLGGSFNLNYYEISAGIGRRKRQNIVDTECEVVATGCPACMLQIADSLSRADQKIKIRHPIEIYADRWKNQ